VRKMEAEEGWTYVADDFVRLVVDRNGLTDDGWTQHDCCAETIWVLLYCLFNKSCLMESVRSATACSISSKTWLLGSRGVYYARSKRPGGNKTHKGWDSDGQLSWKETKTQTGPRIHFAVTNVTGLCRYPLFTTS